jgi:transposase
MLVWWRTVIRRIPDPEVSERARRRGFIAKYKQEIPAAYDAAEPGEKAILRRESCIP